MDRDPATRRNPADAIVVVATPRVQLDAILWQLGIKLALGGSGLLLATSLAVPLALGPGLRPIRQLADRAQTMDVSSFGQPFPTGEVPSELQPICKRLNDLLARLSASFERERRFSADLAHELLTPLAEIRAIAESALKWPETANASDYQRSIEITQRMEMLVTQVLELARTENGTLRVEIISIELAETLRDISSSYKAAAEARGIKLLLDGPNPLFVATDTGALRVIVGNLVSNAVAYAPEGSAVRLYWNFKDTIFEISTMNSAPQIQTEDVPQLFNRFWRKDPARSDSRHSGLGLAVASELASALGGRLTAYKSNGELTFTLHLPTADIAQLS